ncbi:hypothetical protein ACFQNF_02830, partial [Iodobacter arcticus]
NRHNLAVGITCCFHVELLKDCEKILLKNELVLWGDYQQLISPKLSQRDYNGQVGEALVGVKVMNKVIGLGMPILQSIN